MERIITGVEREPSAPAPVKAGDTPTVKIEGRGKGEDGSLACRASWSSCPAQMSGMRQRSA